jgi:hypothetical protein
MRYITIMPLFMYSIVSTCHNVIHGTAFRLAFLCRSGTLSDTTQPLLQGTNLEVSSTRQIARTVAQSDGISTAL